MRLCTYIIQFTHKKGNGWAIVNANSPAQASSVFLRQTKYLDPKVATVSQSPYEGQEMQLVIEGSVDTFAKGVYDLAVINGFNGTEKDFLDSLKGEKGNSFTFEDLTPEQLYLIAKAAPAINNARFDSQNKTISLLHDDEVLSVLDARPFLKDGMLNSVSIVNRRLVLSFNTDAGKEDISLGLNDIFNPDNYYTKTESDARFAGKPFKVTLSSREEGEETTWSADKTFAEILAAYQAGRDIVAIYEGAEVALNEYIVSDRFIFTVHYVNIVQQVFVSEDGVDIMPLTLVDESKVATINSQSLTRGGNITLPTPADITSLQQALANYCPIIEDTRTSATAVITGNAPFDTLVEGQRIMLHLNYHSYGSTSLQLTLSKGEQTPQIECYFLHNNQRKRININDLRAYGFYTMVYNSNMWMLVGFEWDTVYYVITQAQINNGTSTSAQLITPKLLRDNFYLKSESDTRYLPQIVSVDNQSAQVEQALESNKFYKFLNPVEELTLTLVAPTGYGSIAGIYAGKFTASSTWDSLVAPTSVEEAAGNDSISAGKTYEFHILDNVIVIKEV